MGPDGKYPDVSEARIVQIGGSVEFAAKGVWLLWDSSSKESLHAVYPADQEIDVLRKVNDQGFGYAEFVEWGPVL